MSIDDHKIPVAAVAADKDKAARAPPVPVKLSEVTQTAWKCDYGRKTYHFTTEDDLCPICCMQLVIICDAIFATNAARALGRQITFGKWGKGSSQ